MSRFRKPPLFAQALSSRESRHPVEGGTDPATAPPEALRDDGVVKITRRPPNCVRPRPAGQTRPPVQAAREGPRPDPRGESGGDAIASVATTPPGGGLALERFGRDRVPTHRGPAVDDAGQPGSVSPPGTTPGPTPAPEGGLAAGTRGPSGCAGVRATGPEQATGPAPTGHSRSMPAQKAAATRRKKQADRAAEFRRRVFVATHGDEVEKDYGPVSEVLRNDTDASEPTGDFTLDDVIADLVDLMISLRAPDEPAAPGDDEGSFGDVAVWRDGRLLAVVRRGAGGEPEVTRFDVIERDSLERSEP